MVRSCERHVTVNPLHAFRCTQPRTVVVLSKNVENDSPKK